MNGVTTIEATERAPRASASPAGGGDDWTAISEWALTVVARISAEQPGQHVSLFVPDDDGHALRLAAQVWGGGEDSGDVVAGEWLVPFDGSVCGRVFRTSGRTLRRCRDGPGLPPLSRQPDPVVADDPDRADG